MEQLVFALREPPHAIQIGSARDPHAPDACQRCLRLRNTAGPLAGDGEDQPGTFLDDDAPGDAPARGDRQVDAVFVAQRDQLFDRALRAARAFPDVVGELDSAIAVLQAVGHQEEELLRRVRPPPRNDELVVDLDERGADHVLGHPQHLADEGHEREEQPDGHPPHPLEIEQVPAEQDMEDESHRDPQDQEDRGQDGGGVGRLSIFVQKRAR